MSKFDVIIIGGGAVGSGVLRDLSLRGVHTLLVDRGDLASEASGRNHGLLHSGARYVVSDPESALECAEENIILKKIAKHTIEDTGGLFVAAEEKNLEYLDPFLKGCTKCKVENKEITVEEALKRESFLNANIKAAVWVNDAVVDPFLLVVSNVLSALRNGAEALTYTNVRPIVEDGTVSGVETFRNGKGEKYLSEIVVNATGAWAGKVAEQAGVKLEIRPNKGTLVVLNNRVTNHVINYLRPPSDGDIIVPHYSTMILGTTSTYVENPDNILPEKDEIKKIVKECEKMLPIVADSRIIRAFSGVRPLFGKGSGRAVTRGMLLVDHEVDGVEGFVTITGGKLTTYRLMAEKAADLVCEKLGVRAKCRTAEEPLPGSDGTPPSADEIQNSFQVNTLTSNEIVNKYGTISSEMPRKPGLICECSLVSRAEIIHSFQELLAKNLIDVKKRTRLGMGTCQGQFCIHRAAEVMVEDLNFSAKEALDSLANFLDEQWKIAHILEGDQLRQLMFAKVMFEMVGNIRRRNEKSD
ncbi:MAG: anaerobic glycerol-3-phosphate dehydrogenase subunit GlpA [Candidatus Freyarchaeum deiterrae]